MTKWRIVYTPESILLELWNVECNTTDTANVLFFTSLPCPPLVGICSTDLTGTAELQCLRGSQTLSAAPEVEAPLLRCMVPVCRSEEDSGLTNGLVIILPC